MFWVAITLLGIAGLILAYMIVRSLTRRQKKLDAGTVSEDWIQQQRGRS
jgi:hypothetical protein